LDQKRQPHCGRRIWRSRNCFGWPVRRIPSHRCAHGWAGRRDVSSGSLSVPHLLQRTW